MEIKLRAFDESSGEFAYSVDVEQDYYFWCFDRNGQIACYYEVEKGGNHEEPPEIVPEEVSGPYELWLSGPDKNGKEIYEGDMAKGSNPDSAYGFIGEIKFDTEQSMFVLSPVDTVDIPLFEFDEIEIIGNIHENLELVKV